MARVTIEDCLKNVENMYELVHLATKRTRQLFKGSEPLVKTKNRVVVTALREIAAGRVVPEGMNRGGATTVQDDLADLLPLSS